MFDMFSIVSKLKELQAKLKEAKRKLPQLIVVAESPRGEVKVTMSGNKKILSIEIDTSLNDKTMLQELILSTVNQAIDEADKKATDEIKKALPEDIPGLDIASLI